MINHRILFALLGWLLPFLTMAQGATTVPDTLLKSIEADIWLPFMEAYRDYDAEKIMALHTPDIIRVSEKSGIIDKGLPYIEAFGRALTRWQEEDRIMRIAFSIINTSYGSGLVSQRGYYRISAKEPGDAKIIPRGFSEFNVILKITDGKWRFMLDSDRRVKITEEEFQATGLVYELPEK